MQIEVEQALHGGGERHGDGVDEVAVGVEAGGVSAGGKAQGTAPLWMAPAGVCLPTEPEGSGAGEAAADGGQEGAP